MAVYNTPSDAANTAVRSFLTSVGEYYLKSTFNTSSGKGKSTWKKICHEFGELCAYCGNEKKLQIEHLVMFNRSEYGLHHPGNIVPVCNECNKRKKNADNTHVSWESQLATICEGDSNEVYRVRKAKILEHIARYEYPSLSEHERHSIRVIAESLYDNIKAESAKSLNLYRQLDEAFVKKI